MFATKAGAQETLRVGRAIANSWLFVPLDLGMAADPRTVTRIMSCTVTVIIGIL
jgi:hypothetical protein